jgi:hypothetical protein
MILIVANRWDQTPLLVASHWTHQPVAVLTSADLSVSGWRQRLKTGCGARVVAEGKVLDQSDITGVLTLLPWVFENELVDVVLEDRSYVAGEMNAFLLFWLWRLRCPVLNRPTPTSLSGPYWRREKWVSVASQAGIAAEPVRRHAGSPIGSVYGETPPIGATLTVVGSRVFGNADPELGRHALGLARRAGVGLLAVHFSGPDRNSKFISADVFPNFSEESVAGAVLEHLRNRLTGR